MRAPGSRLLRHALVPVCVSVELGAAVSGTPHAAIRCAARSPSASLTGSITRSSPRKVPFLLPKSSSTVPVVGHDQPRVTPGHRGRVEPDLDVGVAADDVFAGRERKALRSPFEPAAHGRGRASARSGSVADGLSAERVAESVRGADDTGARVPDRPARRGSRRSRFDRLASSTNVSGQSRCCSTVFDSTFGRSSTSVASNSNAFGER